MVVAVAAGGRVAASGPRAGGRPGVGAGAAVGGDGQAGERAVERREDDRAAGASASASVVGRNRSDGSVGRDRAGSRDAADPEHHDAAAGRARRDGSRAVVAGSGAAAAPEGDSRDVGRKHRAAIPAGVHARAPGETAMAARSAVAAASAPRVLVVARRVPVRSPAAGVARGSAGHSSGDGVALVRIIGPAVDDGIAGGVVQPLRCPGGAFSLGGVEVASRVGDIVGVGSAGSPGELLRAAAPEPEAVHRNGRAAEGERARDVHGEHSARGSIPARRGEARGQGRRAVLRHAHDLEPPDPMRAVVGRAVVVGVEQAVAGSRPLKIQGASGDGDGIGRDRVFVQAGVAQCGVAAGISGRSAAVGAGVARVDVGVLHLDDEEKVPRGDRSGGPPAGSEGDRGRAGGDRGGSRPIGVDDPGQADAGTIAAGCSAVDGRRQGRGRKEKKKSEKRTQSLRSGAPRSHERATSVSPLRFCGPRALPGF